MQKAGLCPRCSPRVTVTCRQARQEVQRSQHLCGATINVDAATERKYMAMLTMVAKVQRLETSLRGNKRDSLLQQLAAKRSELTSVAFLHWVARMWPGGDVSPAQTSPVPVEAVAASLAVATAGSVSGVVAGSGSVSGQGPGASLGEAGSPRVFGQQLAQALTGRAAVLTGYANPLYDAILSVAPPASLSPQALAESHRQANELAKDLRVRRRSSVASLLARIQVSPEQRDQLLAGSAASRILDLLLSMGSTAERVALLPDCFTPPDLPDDSSPNTGSETGTQPDDEHDALWCTPAQLLTEVDSRLRRMEQAATALSNDTRLLLSNGEQLVDAQLRDALQQLRPAVHEMMLQGLTAAGARVKV
ncbi:hypothetical protein V8C86DRAFT_2431838 [Haematococcus lacustris]